MSNGRAEVDGTWAIAWQLAQGTIIRKGAIFGERPLAQLECQATYSTY